jgi:hypothetical protein
MTDGMKHTKRQLAGVISSHHALRAAARAAGQDEEILRDMLWQLNAGEQLLGLKQVARNLLSILMALRSLDPDPDEDSELLMLRGWDAVLRWIAEALPISHLEISPSDENPNNRAALMRNPLWSSLWTSTEDSKRASQYRLLQGHFLLAHVGFLRRESRFDTRLGRSAFERGNAEDAWSAFADLSYGATLHLRNMASTLWTPIVAQIPLQLEPQIFLEELSVSQFYSVIFGKSLWLRALDTSQLEAQAAGIFWEDKNQEPIHRSQPQRS